MISKKMMLLLFLASIAVSCGIFYEEEPEFDFERVPGMYKGKITCSDPDCGYSGPAGLALAYSGEYYVLEFLDDSIKTVLPNFNLELIPGEVFTGYSREAKAVIALIANDIYSQTPDDEHYFRYWTLLEDGSKGAYFTITLLEKEEGTTNPGTWLRVEGKKGTSYY